MRKYMLFLGALAIASSAYAQTYKTKFSGANKQVVMDIDAKQLDIEGYSGDEVIIEASDLPKVPQEADGLRPLSAGGVDNTNIGLSSNLNGDILRINVVLKGKATYKVKMPQDLNLIIKKRNSCSCNENGMSISGVKGSIEVNTNYEDITLNNVSGPIVANSSQGKIKIVFDDKMPEKPSSIVSYSDNVDITVPEKAKVLFSISASDGNMFTDLDLKPYTPDPKTLEEEKKAYEEARTIGRKAMESDAARSASDRVAIRSQSSGTATTYAPGNRAYISQSGEGNNVVIGSSTNGVVYSFSDGQYKYWDSDRNAPKYVLNEPQTKISIRSTRGNVYLRKKK